MPDFFECPQCGKQYPLERRLAGKAVACDCGHRFLAPARLPPSASAADLPARPATPYPRQPARWAGPQSPVDPPAAEAIPLTEADLIDEPPGAPSASAPTVIYAAPAPLYQEGKKAKRPAGPSTAAIIGACAAAIVLLTLLPVAGYYSLRALLGNSKPNGQDQPPPATEAAPSEPQLAAETPASEPAKSGKLVTIWDGKHRVNNGQLEFSLEYRLDGLRVAPDARYFWVIFDRSGAKAEFAIPPDVLKPRNRLSGQPKGATPEQFQPPFRTYIERQSPGMILRDEISNTIAFPEA